jgi:hypothetical protein
VSRVGFGVQGVNVGAVGVVRAGWWLSRISEVLTESRFGRGEIAVVGGVVRLVIVGAVVAVRCGSGSPGSE